MPSSCRTSFASCDIKKSKSLWHTAFSKDRFSPCVSVAWNKDGIAGALFLCPEGAGALAETNIMKRTSENKEREERIDYEIVVDCYGEEERAMGWYCYAESNMTFPFHARCIAKRASSPLKTGESMEVEGMASEDDCASELMVLMNWNDDNLAVPLMQLELEWCFGPGVMVDVWHRKPGELISISDLQQNLREIKYTLRRNDMKFKK